MEAQSVPCSTFAVGSKRVFFSLNAKFWFSCFFFFLFSLSQKPEDTFALSH